ncbi:MAG: hypothetical protein IIC88_01530 [Chloroflexi bacterium]|nr:hypothetical protein [Chloroflexota bacterium]
MKGYFFPALGLLALGVLVAATLAFTAAEVDRMRRRRTEIGRPADKPARS